MAVIGIGADPLDVALSEIGELVDQQATATILGASAIAGLWQRVYHGALDRNDFELALLAMREWCIALRLTRTLIEARSMSPPP